MSRGMKLTEIQIATLLGAIQVGADMALAAKTIGIARRSLFYSMTEDPNLKELIEEAKAVADEVVIKSLYTKATVDKDTTAMIFWLKNRRPAEWRDRRELNLTADVKSAAKQKALELGIPADAIEELATAIAAEATPEGFVQ